MVWGLPKDGDLRGWGGLGEHGNDRFVPGRCSPYRHSLCELHWAKREW